MAVCKMQRMNIFAMQDDRSAILERLQLWGIMEIDISVQDETLTTVDTAPQRLAAERNVQLLQQTLETLDRYAAEKKSLFAALEGKPLVEKDAMADVSSRADELLAKAQEILKLDKAIAEANAAIAKLENQIVSLTPWSALDVPMGFGGTKKTAFLLGTLPGTYRDPRSLRRSRAGSSAPGPHASRARQRLRLPRNDLSARRCAADRRSHAQHRICQAIPDHI